MRQVLRVIATGAFWAFCGLVEVASGFGDGGFTVTLNGGDNTAYIGEFNSLEIRISNDARLRGMSPSLEISYTQPLSWDLDYGSDPPVNEEGRAVDAWTWGGLTVNHDFDNVSPDRICLGGVAFYSGGIASGPSEICYTLRFYIPPCLPEVESAITILPHNYSSTLTWTFVDSGGSYAPDFNGYPVTSQLDPVAPPVVFSSVQRPRICGDTNCDGSVNISDAVHLIDWVFKGGDAPCAACPYGSCEPDVVCGDVNCDNQANVSDAVHIVRWVFKGGQPPCTGCH